MAAQAVLIPKSRLRDKIRRIAAVKQTDKSGRKRRVSIKIVQMARQVTKFPERPAQTAFRPHDAYIVPHDMAYARPILGDESRVVIMLVSGIFPVGNGSENPFIDTIAPGEVFGYILACAVSPKQRFKQRCACKPVRPMNARAAAFSDSIKISKRRPAIQID